MFYRSARGIIRCLVFHLMLLVIIVIAMLAFLVTGPNTVHVIALVFGLGSFICIARSVVQWYRPSVFEYNGLVYYRNGLIKRCLGRVHSIYVRKSLLGPRFVRLIGSKSKITLYRSDYHIRGIRNLNPRKRTFRFSRYSSLRA